MSTDNTLSMTFEFDQTKPASADQPVETDYWNVTLRYQGRSITVPFFMGYGKRPATPDLGHVLSALMNEASYAHECPDVESFAEGIGMDYDDTKEREEVQGMYEGIVRNTEALKDLFGSDEYFEYLLFSGSSEEWKTDWSTITGLSVELPSRNLPE